MGTWVVPSRQPASFLSTPQSPMAPWSRSPWRTARWCGRRGGSFSDSECAPGQGGGWAGEISPGTPQSFLSPLGTMSSQDPCWPQPGGPVPLSGWSAGSLAGGSPGGPPHLESNPMCLFSPHPRDNVKFLLFLIKEICVLENLGNRKTQKRTKITHNSTTQGISCPCKHLTYRPSLLYICICACVCVFVFYKSRGSPFALFHKALLLLLVNISPHKLVMLHDFKTYVVICYVDNYNFLWPVSSSVFC